VIEVWGGVGSEAEIGVDVYEVEAEIVADFEIGVELDFEVETAMPHLVF